MIGAITKRTGQGRAVRGALAAAAKPLRHRQKIKSDHLRTALETRRATRGATPQLNLEQMPSHTHQNRTPRPQSRPIYRSNFHGTAFAAPCRTFPGGTCPKVRAPERGIG